MHESLWDLRDPRMPVEKAQYANTATNQTLKTLMQANLQFTRFVEQICPLPFLLKNSSR